MMKKICFMAVSFLLMGIQQSFCQSPYDIVYHAAPFSPAIEINSEVVSVGKQGVEVGTQVMTLKTEAQTAKNNMQIAVTSAFNNCLSNTILPLKGDADRSATFYGKKLTKVKLKKIIQKFKELFLVYDSKHEDDIQFVKQQRKNFYFDNVYAVYSAAVSLQKELRNSKAKIKNSQICAQGDGGVCGIPGSSDGGKNEVWFTYGETLAQYDRLVKMWETVAALNARLMAVEALMKIEPEVAVSKQTNDKTDNAKAEDKANSEKLSFNENEISAVFKSHHRETLAFAQVLYKKEKPSVADLAITTSEKQTVKEQEVKLPIEFVSPAEPDTESPLIANEAKLEDLNTMRNIRETVDAAIEAHNTLDEIRHFKSTAEELNNLEKKYVAKVEKLQNSEQCALNFIGKYFNNPVTTWSGVKLGENVNRHGLRKGISGWAVDAFETAKAAETNAVKTDDIETFSLSDGVEDTVFDDPDMTLAEKEANKIDTDLSPSKLNESQKEMRKSSLLSWQIGAEASKMLGSDAKKWGERTSKSLVWTDSKRFYRQYLKRKYENIKEYLKRYTKEDVLAVVVSKLKKEDKDISETNYQKKLAEIEQQAGKDNEDAVAQMKVSMQEYDGEIQAKLEALIKERKVVVAKVDVLEDYIRRDSKSIMDLRSAAEEEAAVQTDETLNAEVVFPENEADASKTTSSVATISALSDSVHTQNAETLDKDNIDNIQRRLDANKKSRNQGNQRIQEIDNQIAEIKAIAQEQRGESKLFSILKGIKEKAEAAKNTNKEGFSAAVTENISATVLGAEMVMAMLNAEAENAVNRLNSAVDAIVDAAYGQILALGDKVYTGEAYPQIVKIHENMINQIKAVKLLFSVSGVIKIDDMLVYAKLLTADVSTEQEGFFVGSMPKARDMKAPFKMVSFEALPVREIFHFDVNDFDAIKPYNESTSGRKLTASEFLNFGGDIPYIWKYILQNKAFVESEYNLKEALSGGCEETAFSRGGIMPCMIDESKIIVDVDEDGNYVKITDTKEVAELTGKQLPRCYHISMKDGKPHHTFFDGDVIFNAQRGLAGIIGGNTVKRDPIDCEYSELGMLLEADEENNLSFKERVYKAYTTLQNSKSNIKKLSNSDKNAMAAASQAMFDKNQIGDFLHHVEVETNEKKNLEEARQDYGEQKAQIKEKLQKIGYTPADKFDISKQEDYNAIVKKVKEIRKEAVNKAEKEISAVSVEDNKPAEEQKETLSRVLSLINLDAEGLVQVDYVKAESPDVEEQVKKAVADDAVVDKLKNSLKEKEKEYSDIDEVFCGNYQ
ncbi:MAG: hypothetical protein MJ210_00445 [Alphaproteobacteria bacterium]|nr:hypothetical protein [Alphaproteobacteria bacterium]